MSTDYELLLPQKTINNIRPILILPFCLFQQHITVSMLDSQSNLKIGQKSDVCIMFLLFGTKEELALYFFFFSALREPSENVQKKKILVQDSEASSKESL